MSTELDIEKEKALIQRVKQNERVAFDDLVAIFRSRGFSVAYSFVGNPEDAKDVLQEAFIKVYLNIGSFKEEARFATWFYRIVTNCSLDFLRKKKTMRRFLAGPVLDDEGKEMEFPDLSPGTREHAAFRDLEDRLDACVKDLPDRQKSCFILKHRNGLTNAQIARVLRCGVPTVKVHLFRAASALRVKMAGFLKEEAGNA